MRVITHAVLCVVLLVNLAACGTILYPERRGQAQGQLDTGVVILDALGLLLFFVPGVIAFAVDFANGTIYLPQGQALQLTDQQQKELLANGRVDMQALQRLFAELAAESLSGQPVVSSASLWQIRKLNSPAQLSTLFASPALVGLPTSKT
ncbi:MAG: polyribonucleotide nucleotidyltransferase [Pseudomonadales bacterium]|nr:polyribonucleotide nucleotidyltransferase [Pseudomonadales bacterium]